ncbi:MAG: polymerase sigma factor CarQ [Pseudomonadota bacterium]|jgi:RNA polymerase sigma-70 factor (ECF subfamily)
MSQEPSDEDLLEGWLVGDSSAFEEFFRRHSSRVVAYAVKKGIQREEALEIVQDVFLKLHANIDHYEVGRRALPWFFTLVHHTCLDRLKRGGKLGARIERATERELDALPAPLNKVDDEGFAPDLTSALSRLPTDQQKILAMRLFEEMSFQEISQRTGRSEVSLRKVYSRALQNIREWMGVRKGDSR